MFIDGAGVACEDEAVIERLCRPKVVRNVSVCLVGVVAVHIVTELHELILGDFDGLFEDGPYDALGTRRRRQTAVIAVVNL